MTTRVSNKHRLLHLSGIRNILEVLRFVIQAEPSPCLLVYRPLLIEIELELDLRDLGKGLACVPTAPY